MNITEGVRENYAHLEGSRPGLGLRYAIFLSASLHVVATALLFMLMIGVFVRRNKLRRITFFQLKSVGIYLVIWLASFYIVFMTSFAPSGGGFSISMWQRLFSTEWAIVTVAFFLLALYAMSFILIFTTVKLARFFGEIDDT